MSALHPLFVEILQPSLNVTAMLKKAETHTATVGHRRPYRSLGDAMAYEAGYLAFDSETPGPTFRTPFADGWADARADHEGGDEVPA